MEYTNRYKWPEEICRAIIADNYSDPNEQPSDYSATTLISPIQKVTLERRYPDKLKVFDVADRLWAFMGQVAHEVLEKTWVEQAGSLAEQRFYAEIKDIVISGKIDCYANQQIRDYKTTKAYKIIKGDYSQWEQQLNIYAYLCAINGLVVDNLCVYAIILDWKQQETRKQNYPQAPIVKIPLRLWSFEEQDAFVRDRVHLLENAKELSDEDLMKVCPCSDAERWADIKDHAVMKVGSDRAVKSCSTQGEAAQSLSEYQARGKQGYYIKTRYSPPTRCLHHCASSPVCLQFKQYQKENGVDGEFEEEGPMVF